MKHASLKNLALLAIHISSGNIGSITLNDFIDLWPRNIDKLFHIASGDWLAKGSTLGLIEVLVVLGTTKRSLMSLWR